MLNKASGYGEYKTMHDVRVILLILPVLLWGCGGGGSAQVNSTSGTQSETPLETEPEQPASPVYSVGPEYENGIEPGDPSQCEAPVGYRCWYVDADANEGGDGSFTMPYNSFETVVGYRAGNGNYSSGLLQGGDYLYVKGVFKGSRHVADGGKSMRLVIGRGAQGGSQDKPTVIKSYRGSTRAIFDGEFTDWGVSGEDTPGMIDISALSSDKLNAIEIHNIELRNARNIGISFKENVITAEVANVVIHDTAIVGGASSSGGIHFRLSDAQHDFILRNSHLYSNRRNEDGVGYFAQANNNIGGVNILNQSGALDGAKIVLYANIIEDEIYAVRHKHSGNIVTEAYGNLISTSIIGFYIRGYRDNWLHHNIIEDTDTALYAEAENQGGDAQIVFYNNTVVGARYLLNTGNNASAYARAIKLRDNIFVTDSADVTLVLGFNSTDVYHLSGWSSGHNLFQRPDFPGFMRHEGVAYAFEDAMAALVDNSSRQADPLFIDAANGNYRLSENSPARAAGSEGQDLGALNGY